MLRDDPVTYILDYDLNLDYDHILRDCPVALRDDPVNYILNYALNLDYDNILRGCPVALRDDPVTLTLCGGAPPRRHYPGGVSS